MKAFAQGSKKKKKKMNERNTLYIRRCIETSALSLQILHLTCRRAGNVQQFFVDTFNLLLLILMSQVHAIKAAAEVASMHLVEAIDQAQSDE